MELFWLQKNPATVEKLVSPGGAWQSMRNTYGAAWQLSGLPAPPWDFRITGSEQLVARREHPPPPPSPGLSLPLRASCCHC